MSRFLLLFMAIPALAWGQIIPNRPTLDALIGGTGTLVDFESYTVAFGASEVGTGITLLNSSTLVNSQGPGLVPAGVVFSTVGGVNLQWIGAGYYASPTRGIDFFSSSGAATIDLVFSVPAQAFGVDLRAFSGNPATASATIYAPDLTTVLTVVTGLNLPTSGAPIFLGYQAAGGIGKVSLAQSSYNWSPLIDNLSFSVIPEPPILQLLAAGLGWLIVSRRRRGVRGPRGGERAARSGNADLR